MKIPRDVSGDQLERMVSKLGYVFVRQKGSHARYTHTGPPQGHIVIPIHKPIKVGTLHDLLTEIATQCQMTLEELVERL